MPSPAKLSHVVLWTRQIPQMRDWYVKVLDAVVVYENALAAFMSYDEEHHRIAVADPVAGAQLAEQLAPETAGMTAGAGSGPPALAADVLAKLPPHGLAHIAFSYDTLEDLLSAYARLADESIKPAMAINHGLTTSLYYTDPDGNQIELQVDNLPTAEAGTAFMKSASFENNPIGVPFDPDDLIRRLRAGESARDLVTPWW